MNCYKRRHVATRTVTEQLFALFYNQPTSSRSNFGAHQEDCCSCLNRTCPDCISASGQLLLDLTNGIVSGSLPGVLDKDIIIERGSGELCDARTRVKVTFEPKVAEVCRNLLKIHMDFDTNPTSRGPWMFDFGDSVSNNGHGGDGNDQYNDAEMDAPFPHVRMWSSDRCNTIRLLDLVSAVDYTTSYADVWIADEYVKFKNNLYVEERCHECLYALNGQNDPDGPINYDVYLAFNRVVSGTSSRNGYGVCRAVIEWQCPLLCELVI